MIRALYTAASGMSAQQTNLDKTGAVCTLNVTAESGAPTVTFNIQNYDSASASYYTVITSGTLTPGALPYQGVIGVHDGSQTSSLPAGVTAFSALPLSRFWRVQQVIAGTNSPAITGTVGCDVVK